MKKSKLLSYLSTFSKDEFKSFEAFIASPYFNTKPDLITFFGLLKKAAPDFKEKKVEKTIIYKALYPSKLFDE